VSRFIDEADRSQGTLPPETIDEYVSEENPVRVIDAFVGALDLPALRFEGTGLVGYNVQTAVDTQRHLIVAHEVTYIGSDRH